MKGKFTKLLQACENQSMGMPRNVVLWRKSVEEWIDGERDAHTFLQLCENNGMIHPVDARELFREVYKIV